MIPQLPPPERPYAGRAGLKLRHALDLFGVGVGGLTCADFGCNVGGFTDCLLRAGAARVYAVDTGYGMLAYPLRIDTRVVVMERANALHAAPPEEPISLIVIDMGWTPQKLCVPAAFRWLGASPGGIHAGRIITLIKPHYEATHAPSSHKARLHRGVLPEEESRRVLDRVLAEMPALGARVLGVTPSPLLGGKGKKNAHGNTEFLALLEGDPSSAS